jgi:hypothetical protein
METGPAPVGGTSPEQVANEVMDTGWHRIANAGKSSLLVVGTQEFVFKWSVAAGGISLAQHARVLGAKDH